MRMRRLAPLLILLFAIAGAESVCAQSPLEKVFPDRFGHWTASSSLIKVKPASEEQSRVLAEAGIVDVMARDYSNSSQQLSIVLYQLRDPSGAYSVLTFLQENPVHSSGKLSAGSLGYPLPVFQVGNFVVEVSSQQDLAEADERLLADAIRKHADATPLPPIREYLPEHGRVLGTERYALGPAAYRAAAIALDRADFAPLADLAGFSSGAEAMFARYKSGANEAVLLLIEYPTPQLAELHLRHLEGALSGAKQGGSSIERKGSLLSIVLGARSAVYAESLRNGVNYDTQVTWNEPSQTATDPPITSVLVKIIIGTGIFMGMAVVLGAAFGGVRVVTKIFFPGKVFDRPERMEILQLGLSGKRIDPRDFY
jgi:hypothetical protein